MDELYEAFHFGQCFGVSRGTGPWQKLLSCLTAAAPVAEKSLGGGRVKAPGVGAEGETSVLGWGGEFRAKLRGECEGTTSKAAVRLYTV